MEVILLQIIDFGAFLDLTVFMLAVVIFCGLLGFMSRSMALGVFGAFLAWANLAIQTQNAMFKAVLWVSCAVVILFMASRVVNFAMGDGL